MSGEFGSDQAVMHARALRVDQVNQQMQSRLNNLLKPAGPAEGVPEGCWGDELHLACREVASDLDPGQSRSGASIPSSSNPSRSVSAVSRQSRTRRARISSEPALSTGQDS